MRVGFIGVGTMGKPMAANIVKGGHEVLVFDANPAVAPRVAQEIGATAVATLDKLAAADIIVTMLPDGNVVRDVALGANGIASVGKPGTIVLDMSSSQPMITRDTGAALALRHIVLIDAPVSGGMQRATTGKLTIMIGSDDAVALERAKPILLCMGDTLFEVGKLGAGHAAKALNNVIAACNYAVLAEALIAGERYGIDRETIVDIVNVSTGQSFCSTVVMKNFVITEKFNTGFAGALLAKDAKIAAELAGQLGTEHPFIQLSAERWAAARDAMGPGEDMSRAIIAWEELAQNPTA
jgi:3-hydroxyisobutyrate dehydrogenase